MFNEVCPPSSCTDNGTLPQVFCWTKMGTEAGQGLEAILQRKELERLSGDGLFAWGIGNSVGPAIRHARELGFESLDVLFTRMKSAPKTIDVCPSEILLWTAYESETGDLLQLPAHVLVTSRNHAAGRAGSKQTHYALLCRSLHSLLATDCEATVDASAVCNLVSSNPTGASQVTAVVRTTTPQSLRKSYPVQFRAKLAGPGFVRLARPALLTADLMHLYREATSATSTKEWRERVGALRRAVAHLSCAPVSQQNLFS